MVCSVITLITLYMDSKVILVWLKKYSSLGVKVKTMLSNGINLSVKIFKNYHLTVKLQIFTKYLHCILFWWTSNGNI